MSKPSKETLRRLAKEAGGIPSRYGDAFGYSMSTIALDRFAEAIRKPLVGWIEDEGARTSTCTFNATGSVCRYCKCGKIDKSKHKE